MRFSAGGRVTGAASSTLPGCALIASATVGATIREIGIFNTTATAFNATLRRLTTAGTPGSTIIAGQPWDINEDGSAMLAASALLKDLYTSTGPTLAGVIRTASIGAAIGAGVIWTFGDRGLVIPKGTANGVGILAVGTGQIFDVYIDWDE